MKRIIEACINNPSWSTIFITLMVILGLLGIKSLKKSEFPELTTDLIIIDLTYPGSSPKELESGVVSKIEKACEGMNGVAYFTSNTSENTCQIQIHAKAKYDIDELLTHVKNAVDQINSFPDFAERPKVYKLNIENKAVLMALSGNATISELQKAAKSIEDDLLSSGLISSINFLGMPNKEINVEVFPEKLKEYNISTDQLATQLANENRDISTGYLTTDKEEFIIRGGSKSTSPDEIEKIVIKTLDDGRLLHLGNIASVKYEYIKKSAKCYYNGTPAICIDINEVTGEDLIVITEHVKAYIKSFNEKNERIQLYTLDDKSIMLEERMELLTKNGIVGLILVLVVLGVFLDLRLAFWTAMGIPISFLGMLFLGAMFDITINQMTLFGMILVVGILVDDGIVIAENIYSKIERGIDPEKAALDGAVQVLPSVTTSVITTIIAFSAFFFLEGTLGKMMAELGYVVVVCLTISLIEAAIVLPVHLRNLKKKRNLSLFRRKVDQGMAYVQKKLYGKLLVFAIRYRWQMLALPIAFSLVVTTLVSKGVIPSSFLPNLELNIIQANIELTPGSKDGKLNYVFKSLDSTVKKVNQYYVKEYQLDEDLVKATLTISGASGDNGQYYVELLQAEQRGGISYSEVSDRIMKALPPIKGLMKLNFEDGNTFGDPVAFTFVGHNLEELEKASGELEAQLRNIPVLTNVKSDHKLGNREIRLDLKPLAYELGLSKQQITTQVRNAFFGKMIQGLQLGDEEVKMWLRYPESYRSSLSMLNDFLILTPLNKKIRLGTVVDYTIERDWSIIRHFNGKKSVTVGASLMNSEQAKGVPLAHLNKVILPGILKKYSSISLQKNGQERMNSEVNDSLLFILPLLLIGIYFILVINSGSFLQPLIILLMIPLAVYGAQLGHLIEGKSLVIMSNIGMLALTGIIINDSVVFLERYNENIRRNNSMAMAIYHAGISRFRSIFLTSVTTLAGLYPLIFEKSLQAQFLIPLAVTVAWGVLLGTMFILIVFPSYIAILNDVRLLWYKIWVGGKTKREKIEPAFKRVIGNKLDQEEV